MPLNLRGKPYLGAYKQTLSIVFLGSLILRLNGASPLNTPSQRIRNVTQHTETQIILDKKKWQPPTNVGNYHFPSSSKIHHFSITVVQLI